jgi:aspartyl-tRNA(Asn)/glutamyl-tRNA(Gln) amidotransferase subunit A
VRIAVPETLVLHGMEPEVAAAFDTALARLSKDGARITRIAVPEFTDLQAANLKGGFAAAEAYAWHQTLLAEKGTLYDPRIRARIERGAAMSAADYITLRTARARLIARFDARTADFDVLAMPTTPILPARIADLEDERAYNQVNLASLRNTALGNFLDRCAISMPCTAPGEPPVGLMLMGETMGDARLFAIAAAVEQALQA